MKGHYARALTALRYYTSFIRPDRFNRRSACYRSCCDFGRRPFIVLLETVQLVRHGKGLGSRGSALFHNPSGNLRSCNRLISWRSEGTCERLSSQLTERSLDDYRLQVIKAETNNRCCDRNSGCMVM